MRCRRGGEPGCRGRRCGACRRRARSRGTCLASNEVSAAVLIAEKVWDGGVGPLCGRRLLSLSGLRIYLYLVHLILLEWERLASALMMMLSSKQSPLASQYHPLSIYTLLFLTVPSFCFLITTLQAPPHRAAFHASRRRNLPAAIATPDTAVSSPLADTNAPHEPHQRPEPPHNNEKGGFGSRCEYIWDCESPLQCCDLVLSKVCCNGGVGVPTFLQPPVEPRAIPIPVESAYPQRRQR